MGTIDYLRLAPGLGFSKGWNDAAKKKELIEGIDQTKIDREAVQKAKDREEQAKAALDAAQGDLEVLQKRKSVMNVDAQLAEQEKLVDDAKSSYRDAHLSCLQSLPQSELKLYVEQAKSDYESDASDDYQIKCAKENEYKMAYMIYLQSMKLEDLKRKFDAIGVKSPMSPEQMIYADRIQDLGDLSLRNNGLNEGSYYYQLVNPVAGITKIDEIRNMLNITLRPLLQWNASLEYPLKKEISVTEQTPAYDGENRPWVAMKYKDGASSVPIYKDKAVSRVSQGDSFRFNSPPLSLARKLPECRIGGSHLRVDHGGTADSYFTFYPYMSEDTPSYIAAHNGQKYISTRLGTINSWNLNGEASVDISSITWKDFFSHIGTSLNKINFRYDITGTQAGVTAYPNYQYDETKKDLISEEIFGTFSSLRHDFAVLAETQTLPLFFEWPYAFYTALSYGFKYSRLSNRSMADRFILNDENYVAPAYFMDNPFTGDEISAQEKDHAGYTQKRKEALNKLLDAKEYRIGIRSSAPGIMQILKLFGLVDINELKNGKDENLLLNSSCKWAVGDKIMKTSNGLDPSALSYFNPWVKYKNGDVNHNNIQDNGETWERGADGKWVCDPAYKIRNEDFHADIEPYNSFSWNLQLEYKLRVGHLTKMLTPWDNEYGFNPADKKILCLDNYGLGLIYKTIPRLAWYVPGLIFPAVNWAYSNLPQKLFGKQLDMGRDNDTPIYIPLELSLGREYFKTTDINTGEKYGHAGKSFGFGIGLGVGKDFQIMYRSVSTDNGYNYTDKTRSVTATYRF
ncbi:MAG: hypothetical protein ABH860_03990 [bacterium]